MRKKFIEVGNDERKAIAFANSLDMNYLKNVQKVKVKDHYVPTLEVVNKLKNEGWKINGVAEIRNKKSRKIQENIVQMQHPDFAIKNALGKDEAFSSLTISNSCNGSKPLTMGLGAYRMVCSNGMIAYDSHAEKSSINHTEQGVNNIDTILANLNNRAQSVITHLSGWKDKQLTKDQIKKLSLEAAKLKYTKLPENFSTDSLADVRRDEDKSNDLWTVYNRIQENLTEDVKDPQMDIWLNQQLHNVFSQNYALA